MEKKAPNNPAKIVGTGVYLPLKTLTNQDLEKMVQTSDEWIFTRTGIKERRIANNEESTSEMGKRAALKALESAHLSPSDIDLILVATFTPDFMFPSTACLIQALIEAPQAACLDIQAACSGYLYALATAKSFIESGMYQNVLIVASEKISSIIDYTDRNTCILFGDGASAAVISSKGDGLKIENVCLGADGSRSNLLHMPGGGSRIPASKESIDQRLHYLQMNGKEVFKYAIKEMESISLKALNALEMNQSEIKWVVSHQANVRIIEMLALRLNLSMDKFFINLDKYGNTSAASVGIALHELLRMHSLNLGDRILLTAFGAGLTWGSSILTYEGSVD